MLTAASFRPAIAAALAAVGLAALSGCATSFDYATDQKNIIANGGYGQSSGGPANELNPQVNVNGAVIVATPTADGSVPATAGVFTATITLAPQVNSGTVSPAAIKNVAVTNIGIWDTPSVPTSDKVAPAAAVNIVVKTDSAHPAGSINLADPSIGGIAVKGVFTPGDIVPIVLTLANGAKVEFSVPVVNACGFHKFAVPAPNAASAAAYSAFIAPTDGAEAHKPANAASVGPYDCTFAEAMDYPGVKATEPSEPATAAH